MKVERSKTGRPILAESGGSCKNTGEATIVCGAEGQPLKPLFVPKGYSNGDHAIFVVVPQKTHLVHASWDKRGKGYSVEKIVGIDENDNLIIEEIGSWENGECSHIPLCFLTAGDAAIEKAKCYHCRHLHFAS